MIKTTIVVVGLSCSICRLSDNPVTSTGEADIDSAILNDVNGSAAIKGACTLLLMACCCICLCSDGRGIGGRKAPQDVHPILSGGAMVLFAPILPIVCT